MFSGTLMLSRFPPGNLDCAAPFLNLIMFVWGMAYGNVSLVISIRRFSKVVSPIAPQSDLGCSDRVILVEQNNYYFVVAYAAAHVIGQRF